jgi:DNA-binding CsgD family transcriptional regulator
MTSQRRVSRKGDLSRSLEMAPSELPPPQHLQVWSFTVGEDQFALIEFPLVPSRFERNPGRPLSPGEQAVVELVLRGLSSTEIARVRGTSRRTVANQLATAYDKLGVKSRRELAAMHAAQRGERR